MTSATFLRKAEYINKRYPKADDKFKAKMLTILCEEKGHQELMED